jgi:hypothetical protein
MRAAARQRHDVIQLGRVVAHGSRRAQWRTSAAQLAAPTVAGKHDARIDGFVFRLSLSCPAYALRDPPVASSLARPRTVGAATMDRVKGNAAEIATDRRLQHAVKRAGCLPQKIRDRLPFRLPLLPCGFSFGLLLFSPFDLAPFPVWSCRLSLLPLVRMPARARTT